jgi:hypothetical protein
VLREWFGFRLRWDLAVGGGLTGLSLQQPLDGDHAFPGRGQPHPALLLAPLGQAVSRLGVGDQA